MVNSAGGTSVCLEVGAHRSFASAVDWPGWCRSGRDRVGALAALAAYAPRYARVAARAAVGGDAPGGDRLVVVATVDGNAVTDFGAPSVICDLDRRPLDAAASHRIVHLLDAAWVELAAVVASAPASLRKGPRGGGRDRDAMVGHVVDAERGYARHIGVRLTAAEWRSGGVELLRERIRDALSHAGDGQAAECGWPLRYFARRLAWHALDHVWEIEDRST